MPNTLTRETGRRVDGIMEAFTLGNAHEHEQLVRRLSVDYDRVLARLAKVREVARNLGRVSVGLDELVDGGGE
mgnify:FL=1